jgi:hypothetical protein
MENKRFKHKAATTEEIKEILAKLSNEDQVKFLEKLKSPLKAAALVDYRGSVIHYSTLIERTLDKIIVEFFCKEERQIEFIHVLLGNEFFLGKKIEMVWFIIENYCKKELIKFPNTYNALDTFKNNRNAAAHRYFDENAKENKNLDTLYLQHYKTERNKIKIKHIAVNTKEVFENMITVQKILEDVLYNIQYINRNNKKIEEIKMLKEIIDNETLQKAN